MPPEQQELVTKAIVVGITLIGWGIWQWRKKLKDQEEPVDESSVIVHNENHNFDELLQSFVEKSNEENSNTVSIPVPLILEPVMSDKETSQPKIIENIHVDENISEEKISEMIKSGMNNRDIARILKLSTTEVEILVELQKRGI
ncbi:MAG: hypothetical protein WCO98_13885 [bacterium]